MSRNRFSRGDRVRLDPVKADRWVNLYRKFAESGREATVIHTPGERMGSSHYVIRFDVKRTGARAETLECVEDDLLPVSKGT